MTLPTRSKAYSSGDYKATNALPAPIVVPAYKKALVLALLHMA